MFEYADKSFGEIQKLIKEYQDKLDRLQDEESDIYDTLRKLYDRYNSLDNEAYETAYSNIQNRAAEIFLKNAQEAVIQTKEYDYQPFRERLFSIATDGRLFSIAQTETGGRVNINMDVVAGTLADYIEGIEFAKGVLDMGKIPNPDVASKIWREKIYRVDREGGKVTKKYKGKYKKGTQDITHKYKGKYKKTIEARLSSLATIAPFWSIIEYGTSIFPGKGGYAYPEFEGTRFVEKTRIQVQQLFNDLYGESIQQDTDYYRNAIDRYERAKSAIRRELNEVGEILRDLIGAGVGGEPIEPKVSKMEVAFELVDEYISETREIDEGIEEKYRVRLAEKLVSGDTERTYIGKGYSPQRLVNLQQEFLTRLQKAIDGE